MNKQKQHSSFSRSIKKFFLSAFVVVSFAAYALENHGPATGAQASTPATEGNLPPQAAAPTTPSDSGASQGLPAQPAPTQQAAPTTAPSQQVFNTPAPTQVPTTSGRYKNGTYTGPVVDAYYGYVQVQAVVQNGQITNVQFLQYPQDRRTSQEINSYAVPVLQQEAVQAQSANVNLITGATLTSEGFQQSLQSALSQAGG